MKTTDTDLFICPCCQEEDHILNGTEDWEGNRICPDCLDNVYETCSHCQEWVHVDDTDSLGRCPTCHIHA